MVGETGEAKIRMSKNKGCKRLLLKALNLKI